MIIKKDATAKSNYARPHIRAIQAHPDSFDEISFDAVTIKDYEKNLPLHYRLDFYKKYFSIFKKTTVFFKYSRGSEFIRRPYRFPRGTVEADRTAYRSFLTVFRDFSLKARTLPRFKQSRFAV